MTPAARYKVTLTTGIVVLVLVAVQVVLLVSGWTGVSGDWLKVVVVVCQFAFALTALVGGAQAQKRGSSEAAPPVDNSH